MEGYRHWEITLPLCQKKGSAVVDYFLTGHQSLKNVIDYTVIPMTEALNKYGYQEVSCAPSSISDHSLIMIDILPYDPDNADFSHTDSTTCGAVYHPENGPVCNNVKLPSRFQIKEVPSEFLTSEESRDIILKIIDKIESRRITQEEVNLIYTDINKLYTDEMAKYFKIIDNTPLSKRKYRCTSKEWWDDELSSLWKDMHQAERDYLKTKKNRGNFKQLRLLFKAKQDLFDKKCKKKKRRFQRPKCTELEEINSSNPIAFWDYIKRLGPAKKRQIPKECLDDKGNVIKDINIVLEKWKTDFHSLYSHVHKPHNDKNDFKSYIKREILAFESRDDNEESPILNTPFSTAEISVALSKTKCNKAPGIDGVTYEVLKNEMSVILLTRLFNICFEWHLVPEQWLQSIIYPVPKSPYNDPRVPLNYRGVSLLSVISKLYTSTLNARLNGFAEDNGLIENEQNGFQAGRSCMDHIFVLSDTLRIRKALNLQTYCAFIDFKKAFDYVDHDNLLYKLGKLGISGHFYYAIKALYTNNQSCVQINDIATQWFDVESGVRQGDSLSPTLFSLFVNDLAKDIKDLGAGIMIGGDIMSILLYADDILLTAPTAENLQAMLDVADSWCRKWGMVINAA